MSSFLWLNGAVYPITEASLSPWDLGWLVGEGVFDTLVVRLGRCIALREHWERLQHSCQLLGLFPPTEAQLKEIIDQLLTANQMTEARVRVTLTSGPIPFASPIDPAKQTLMVTFAPLPIWPAAECVCLSPWAINPAGALNGIKSVSYGESARSLRYAKSVGCGEALLLNTRNEVSEGSGSNVFLVIDGSVITPPLSSGCLPGVTRLLVLQACRDFNIACNEEPIPLSLLERCEEAFLTSATRGVHPIERLNTRVLKVPGPITVRVQNAYSSLVEK